MTRAHVELARIDQTKTDFIQVSADELHTPAASLMGYAQMLNDNSTVQDDSQLQVLVGGIVRATKRLHRVFNNILDVSRVMTEGLEISRSPVSLAIIFNSIAMELESALEERNISLEQKGLTGLPVSGAIPVFCTRRSTNW